jgi:hypothetical protein
MTDDTESTDNHANLDYARVNVTDNTAVPLPQALIRWPWQDDDSGYGLAFTTQRQQDNTVARAVKDGVDFELSPATAEVAARNAAKLKRWSDKRKRQSTNAFPSAAGADVKRRRALAALAGRCKDLSETKTCRDDATRDGIWYLAGLVNIGALTRQEVTDAVIASAYANGLDRDRANGGIDKIRRDIQRGLDNATHEHQWNGRDFYQRKTDREGPAPISERGDAMTANPTVTADTADDESLLDRLGVTAQWLDEQQFDELEYAVPQLIPEGFGLLAAPPKKGKSFLVGNIGLAVASGGLALQRIEAKQRPVLYLALEDGYRRLQDRLRRMHAGQPLPPNMTLVIKATPLEAVATIREYLERYGTEKPLVIVDTLGKVKRAKLSGEESYQADYAVGAQFKELADFAPGTTVLVVHHTRKAVTDDFVDALSGTYGIAGSADFVMVLARERNSNDAVLSVTGRDVIESEYGLYADDGVFWRLYGADLAEARSAADVISRMAQLKRSHGQRAVAVVRYVNEDQRIVTPADIAERFDMEPKRASELLTRLEDGGYLTKVGRGEYGSGV